MLRKTGHFTCHEQVVHDDDFRGRQDVLDPEVIRVCGEHGWFLLTGDSDLTRLWSRELIGANIGVLCRPIITTDRSCGEMI